MSQQIPTPQAPKTMPAPTLPPKTSTPVVSPVNQTESSMAWDDIRTSPAFPAIIGGAAGALGGIALILIVSQLRKPKKSLPAAYDASGNPMNVVYLPTPNQFRILGFTIGDLIALGTIGLTLFRQIREIAQQNELEQSTTEMPPSPTLPPPPTNSTYAPPKK